MAPPRRLSPAGDIALGRQSLLPRNISGVGGPRYFPKDGKGH
jgi:hypothetical protein